MAYRSTHHYLFYLRLSNNKAVLVKKTYAELESIIKFPNQSLLSDKTEIMLVPQMDAENDFKLESMTVKEFADKEDKDLKHYNSVHLIFQEIVN